MSNANRNLLGTVVHALDRMGRDLTRWAVCGPEARYTGARHEVTCKRCLASLAKRDREFQRKARLAFALAFTGTPTNVYRTAERLRLDSLAAIAREEGASL